MILPIVLSTLALVSQPTAPVVLRPPLAPTQQTAAGAPSAGAETSCDDGSFGGTLFESLEAYYGNQFSAPCAAAALQGVVFVHFGNGLPGPYLYRLHLLDAQCREIGVSDVRSAVGAPDTPATVEVDLSSHAWCVGSEFYLFVEPLTCADGMSGTDCYPALAVDATSSNDPGVHCARVNVDTYSGRQCLAARSADDRYFDFRLRARLDCQVPGCTSPIAPTAWSTLKQLYRDPSASSPR